jgi:hypothetical protein
MKRGTWKAAILPAVLTALSAARPAAADDALALRRVLLSSGGVGYFEYEARVQGNADLPLTVPLAQVDDVLKSVVAYDTAGTVGEVTLPGKEPSDRAFRDLPFDASALASEPALLDALRGARVSVTTADGTIEGRVLSVTVENTVLPDRGGTVERHRLSLEADGGVRSVILEDVTSLAFLDPTLKAQIDAALASLLGQKERGRRTFVVHVAGTGDRLVRVGYVVAVPLWKSTYRLTLPADPAAKKGDLVGWAVVENQSGADWNDVDLTLVSGNPVTFRQALYEAYYVDRPEIPVEVVGRVLPRLDTGAVGAAQPEPAAAEAPALPADGHRAGHFRRNEGFGGAAFAALPASGPDLAGVTPAEATETVTQVVFHLPAPVSVADGQEALLPVIDREIPVERVSLYQPDVDAHHPISSVEITNDGDTGLPPGVVTTYEVTADGTLDYAGDARLDTLPPGEKRFASYGVDEKVRVDRSDHDDQLVTLATIEGGVLELTRTERKVTDYTIAGAAREPRTVVIEHPRVPDFEPDAATKAKLYGTTDRFYRIRVDVPAGKTVSEEVTLEHPVSETVVLATLTSADLGAYASSRDLPPALRDALHRAADLRRDADDKARAVKDLEDEIARIVTDQARIRDDLKAVPAGGALAERYLGMLAQEEDRIAELQKRLDTARIAEHDAEKALSDYLRSLHLHA